jgi:hypothetical protein
MFKKSPQKFRTFEGFFLNTCYLQNIFFVFNLTDNLIIENITGIFSVF